MSFILDALDRSRRERDKAPLDPGVDAAMHGSQAGATGFSPVPILLLALAVAIAVIVWLWLSRMPLSGSAPLPAAATAPSPASQAAPVEVPVLPIESGEVAAQLAPDRVADARAAAVSRLYRDAAEQTDDQDSETLEQATGDTETQGPAGAPAAEQMAAEQMADADMDAAGPEASAVAGESVDTLVSLARAALDNRDLGTHPVPMLEELSPERRDAIPTIMYSQHDYRTDRGASSVLINRQRCEVGDSAGAVRVEEILPDSVILQYRGTVFRLRALNSWVNL